MESIGAAAGLAREDSGDNEFFRIEDGVAIIPVDGVILRRQLWGFGAGLTEIGSALSSCVRNPLVRAILFNVSSPGGTARGVKELADEIAKVSAIKPCAAYVDGLCASAAYWLASATGRIYAGPSSEVGSIGVIMRHVDMSGANEECGFKFTYITAGSYKALGNPDNPLTDRDLAVLQARVNAIYEMFYSDVATHMRLDPEKRLAWADGRDFLAGEAASLGLVTEIVSGRDEVIAKLAKENPMNRTELAAQHPELLASIEADAKEAAMLAAKRENENAIEKAVANTLAMTEIALGKEAADMVRALSATGMTPEQLQAAANIFHVPGSPAPDAKNAMLAAIQMATPAAVSGNAASPDDAAAAFIKRVGAM